MKRPRIKKDTKESLVVNDPLEFKSNCASKNAQCIHQYDELKVELWCDKHYFQRVSFGDDNGERNGIEVEGVQDLIIKSFKYLLDIYLRGITFQFINYFNPQKPKTKTHRIVLKTSVHDDILNVVAEIHYLNTSMFEITVITAMVVDDFNIADGQYSLFIQDCEATLSRNVQRRMTEIYKLSF